MNTKSTKKSHNKSVASKTKKSSSNRIIKKPAKKKPSKGNDLPDLYENGLKF